MQQIYLTFEPCYNQWSVVMMPKIYLIFEPCYALLKSCYDAKNIFNFLTLLWHLQNCYEFLVSFQFLIGAIILRKVIGNYTKGFNSLANWFFWHWFSPAKHCTMPKILLIGPGYNLFKCYYDTKNIRLFVLQTSEIDKLFCLEISSAFSEVPALFP